MVMIAGYTKKGKKRLVNVKISRETVVKIEVTSREGETVTRRVTVNENFEENFNRVFVEQGISFDENARAFLKVIFERVKRYTGVWP
jgi:hypothetical protein